MKKKKVYIIQGDLECEAAGPKAVCAERDPSLCSEHIFLVVLGNTVEAYR